MNHEIKVPNLRPWLGGIDMVGAATTADWTDDEPAALAIQPAKALAFAAAAGGNGWI